MCARQATAPRVRGEHLRRAIEAILDGLQCLVLDWEGEPLSQFE